MKPLSREETTIDALLSARSYSAGDRQEVALEQIAISLARIADRLDKAYVGA